MAHHWYAPLDPDCPTVRDYRESVAEDPIMQLSGCAGEFYDRFSDQHRAQCEQCQQYGAANIEIGD